MAAPDFAIRLGRNPVEDDGNGSVTGCGRLQQRPRGGIGVAVGRGDEQPQIGAEQGPACRNARFVSEIESMSGQSRIAVPGAMFSSATMTTPGTADSGSLLRGRSGR